MEATADNDRLCSFASSSDPKVGMADVYGSTIDTMNRIMDYYSLSQLLRPLHRYFKDKRGTIESFRLFRQDEHKNHLLSAVLSGEKGGRLPRENPERRKQLARSNTGRKIKMMKKLIEKYNLVNFKMTFLTLTMPKNISEYLAGQENGKDMAWRLFEKFWAGFNEYNGSGIAAHVNMHTWKSENPLLPHWHFHTMIPNYRMYENGIEDDDGSSCYDLKEMDWHRQKSGRLVPYSEDGIIDIKVIWGQILFKFCQRHKISWRMASGRLGYEKLNIHIYYAGWQDIGRIKLMHWFNYQGRYPLEDYAKYSNEHPQCKFPEKWLTGYENHNRAYGWWKKMNVIAKIPKDDMVKTNPVTGGEMKYKGTCTLYELINKGRLGFLEVIRGKPIFHRLSGKELAWLLSVQKYRHPAVERDMMYESQAREMEENNNGYG